MKTAAILLLLSQHAAAFSTPAQLSVAPRAILRSSGIQCANHAKSRTYLRMSSADIAAVPSEPKEDPLFESVGKAIVRDYKARLPLYKSDIADGLNTQV